MALRVLTTEFQHNKRCVSCDIPLSTSLLDTKPIALEITKSTIKPRKQYQCISCVIKGKAAQGHYKFKVTLEEIKQFLGDTNV